MKEFKVLLLNPPFHAGFSRTSRSPATTKGGTLYYPIWLSYATGVLEKGGFDVMLLDSPAKKYGLEKTMDEIKRFSPSMVVIDTSTPSILSDIKVAERIKKEVGAFVVLVGTHVSSLPEKTLKSSRKIDAVARREYDYVLRDLARALDKGKSLRSVKGLTFREGPKIIHNPDRPAIEDLDEIPFVTEVYKKHLDVRDYFYSSAEYPMVMIMTGRGCPSMCIFCNWPQVFQGRKYRLRTPENVVAEFEYVLKNLPEAKEIGIEDDTLTADIGRLRKICTLLIKKGINKRIKWWANIRVNLDLESMKMMKEAGCGLLIPGYESGVQEILNNVKKGVTLEQSLAFSKNAKKIGMFVHGRFILGLPGEALETAKKTIEFAKKLDPDDAQFFPLMVYPGTEAYGWAKRNRYLLTEDYSKWLTPEGWHNSVVSTPHLSNRMVMRLCDKAKIDFYMRPKFIVKTFKLVLRDKNEAMRVLKASKKFFRYLIRALTGFH